MDFKSISKANHITIQNNHWRTDYKESRVSFMGHTIIKKNMVEIQRKQNKYLAIFKDR